MFHLEENEAPKSLPACLHKLPAEEKMSLSQAMSELANAGLTEVKNITDIKDILVDKLGLRNQLGPKDSFLSEYAKMNLWCWTPSKWKSSCEGAGLPIKAANPEWVAIPSNEDDSKTWQKTIKKAKNAVKQLGFNLKNPDENEDSKLEFDMDTSNDDERKAKEKRGKAEQLTKFWQAQIKTRFDEVEFFATENFQATTGEGAACLFSFMETGWSAPAKKERTQIEWKSNTGLCCAARSVIMVHIGEYGCELGAAAWDKILKDQGLSEGKQGSPLEKDGLRGDPRVHFYETGKGKLVPRASVIRSGNPASEFGKYGCSPVDIVEQDCPETFWGAGYTSSGESAGESIRRQFEMANSLESVILTHSLGEDFDCGFACKSLVRLKEENPKKPIWSLALTPGQRTSLTPMGVWAGIMGMQSLLQSATASILIDLPQIKIVAQRKLRGLGLAEPTNSDLFGLTKSIIPGLTSGLIYSAANASSGSIATGPRKLGTNLVPYPRIKFLAPSVGPIMGASEAAFGAAASNDKIAYQGLSLGALSAALLEKPKTLAIGAIFRGLQYHKVSKAVGQLKSNRDFQCVDWNPTGFHLSGPSNFIGNQEAEVVSLYNTNGFGNLFHEWTEYAGENQETIEADASKHWVGGLERGDFDVAKEDLTRLQSDYNEASVEAEEPEEDEEEY